MKKLALLLIGIFLTSLAIGFVVVGCSQPEAVFITTEQEITTATRFVDEDGDAYGIREVDNKPQVSSMPFAFDVALRNVPSYFSVNKFGHNPGVAASLETVWTGSNLYPWMLVADQLEILSADADDTAAGTGARTLEIFGLDANYAMITELVTLNGTGVVTSSKNFLRIYRAIVRSGGSSGWNEGLITIRDQDTDVARALIDEQENQTLMAVFTIPAGQTGFMTSWYAGSSFNKDTHIGLYIRPPGEVFQVKRHIHVNRQSYTNRFDFPEMIPEKSDIEVRAEAAGGGGDVSAGFFLWCEEN